MSQFVECRVLGVPYISANIYCKSRNLPNTDIHYYSIDFGLFLAVFLAFRVLYLEPHCSEIRCVQVGSHSGSPRAELCKRGIFYVWPQGG